MTETNFEPVMDEVFESEGGYVDHPDDPGGATNYGITHITLADFRGKAVSKFDVRSLTRVEARAIYRANYWAPLRCDRLPAGFDLVAMDGGVNSGVRRGAKWLQMGLGVAADGKIGEQTIGAALAAMPGSAEITRACDARLGFLRGLRHWPTFGKGWGRRVARVEAVAIGMAVEAAHGRAEAARAIEAEIAGSPARVAAADNDGARDARAPFVSALGGTGAEQIAPGLLPDWALPVMLAVAGILLTLIVIKVVRRKRHEADRIEALTTVKRSLT